jgi:hypothetical protein
MTPTRCGAAAALIDVRCMTPTREGSSWAAQEKTPSPVT